MTPLAGPGDGLQEAMDAIVQLLEQQTTDMRASILLLGDGALRHCSAPHLPAEYCDAIDGTPIGPTAGSCGTAAYRGEVVVVEDIATDPLWADFRHLALPHGLAACWSTPILDDAGKVLGTFALYADVPRAPTDAELALAQTGALLASNILQRARLTETLRASEERYRFMMESIPVQVWTARPDGRLDFTTHRVARYSGRQVHELLGVGWADIVHPDDLPRVSAAWARSIAAGEPYDIEFRLYSAADDAYRWHLVRADALRDDEGRIVQWFGTNTDIEQQKNIEAARDAALLDAQSANRSKLDFLAMISHELRTPLNAIGGYTQLMLEGIPTPPSEAHTEYLQRIDQSQQYLLSLIDDVLIHAKITAGKVNYRISEFPLSEILETLETLTAPQRSTKDIRYDCTGCDDRILLRADSDKTLQVLLNVISNAVKFTPTGGSVTVATQVRGSHVAIIVQDTGVGMSEGQVERVFEPYVQFDNAPEGTPRGTGLGMPISRELARAMSGDLTAESDYGAGSTFILTLPLAAEHANSAHAVLS